MLDEHSDGTTKTYVQNLTGNSYCSKNAAHDPFATARDYIETRKGNNKFIYLVGCSGIGKTSFLKGFICKEYDAVIYFDFNPRRVTDISPDEIQDEIRGFLYRFASAEFDTRKFQSILGNALSKLDYYPELKQDDHIRRFEDVISRAWKHFIDNADIIQKRKLNVALFRELRKEKVFHQERNLILLFDNVDRRNSINEERTSRNAIVREINEILSQPGAPCRIIFAVRRVTFNRILNDEGFPQIYNLTSHNIDLTPPDPLCLVISKAVPEYFRPSIRETRQLKPPEGNIKDYLAEEKQIYFFVLYLYTMLHDKEARELLLDASNENTRELLLILGRISSYDYSTSIHKFGSVKGNINVLLSHPTLQLLRNEISGYVQQHQSNYTYKKNERQITLPDVLERIHQVVTPLIKTGVFFSRHQVLTMLLKNGYTEFNPNVERGISNAKETPRCEQMIFINLFNNRQGGTYSSFIRYVILKLIDKFGFSIKRLHSIFDNLNI